MRNILLYRTTGDFTPEQGGALYYYTIPGGTDDLCHVSYDGEARIYVRQVGDDEYEDVFGNITVGDGSVFTLGHDYGLVRDGMRVTSVVPGVAYVRDSGMVAYNGVTRNPMTLDVTYRSSGAGASNLFERRDYWFDAFVDSVKVDGVDWEELIGTGMITNDRSHDYYDYNFSAADEEIGVQYNLTSACTYLYGYFIHRYWNDARPVRIVIPEGIECASNAFLYLDTLEEIVFPESLKTDTTFNHEFFCGFDGLRKITAKMDSPFYVANFSWVPSGGVLEYPGGRSAEYADWIQKLGEKNWSFVEM